MDENEKIEGKERKKKIIKRVAIIFIIVLLLLTFFSNTIMNYSLPEVSTTTVTSGSVTQKVRCQGIVETAKDLEVTVSGKRTVKEVLVESGDEVKKGQVLVTFDSDAENSELKEAEKTLKDLELAHEKKLLQAEGIDYSDDYREIEKDRKAVADAEEALNKARADAAAADAAKADAEALQGQIDAQNAVVEGIKAKFDELSEAYNYNEVQEKINEKYTEISDFEEKNEALNADIAECTTNLERPDANVEELNQKIEDDKANIEINNGEIERLKAEIAELEASVAAVTELAEQVGVESAKLQELKDKQGESAGDGAAGGEDTVKLAEDALKTAQETLDTKLRSFEKQKKKDAVTKMADDMDMQKEIEELEAQRLKVEKLKDQDDTAQVVASADGIITGISLKEGDTVTNESPIATIQLAESGYEVVTTVPKSEGSLIHVGDEAYMENVWSSDATAVVKSVKPDPEDPSKNLVVKFSVKGEEISLGMNIQFAVGEKNARYDTIVPNNAIKEDSKGNFVLVVKVKGTPLGNRYIVKRVDVKKVASDTTKTAISGEVSEYDNIVTNSTKRLENGQQVRLSEKQ